VKKGNGKSGKIIKQSHSDGRHNPIKAKSGNGIGNGVTPHRSSRKGPPNPRDNRTSPSAE